MGTVTASPAAWALLPFSKTGCDLYIASMLPFDLWPLEKKPSKGPVSWTSLGGELPHCGVHTRVSAAVRGAG